MNDDYQNQNNYNPSAASADQAFAPMGTPENAGSAGYQPGGSYTQWTCADLWLESEGTKTMSEDSGVTSSCLRESFWKHVWWNWVRRFFLANSLFYCDVARREDSVTHYVLSYDIWRTSLQYMIKVFFVNDRCDGLLLWWKVLLRDRWASERNTTLLNIMSLALKARVCSLNEPTSMPQIKSQINQTLKNFRFKAIRIRDRWEISW